MSQKSKEEILQKLEDEKLCSQETKKFDQLLSKNQRLIQRTDAEMKQAKRLQVSESFNLWVLIVNMKSCGCKAEWDSEDVEVGSWLLTC